MANLVEVEGVEEGVSVIVEDTASLVLLQNEPRRWWIRCRAFSLCYLPRALLVHAIGESADDAEGLRQL